MARCHFFMRPGKGSIEFLRAWNSSKILLLPCCLTGLNPNILTKWQFCAVWNHWELTGTKNAVHHWQKPFHRLQPAVWVHALKTFEIWGAESLGLHLSIIFFGVTQEFAVSKFYSFGIMNIIHLCFRFIFTKLHHRQSSLRYKIYMFSEGLFYCSQ